MKKYCSPEMEVELFDAQDMFHFSSPTPDISGCNPESGICKYDCNDDAGCLEYFNPPCPAEWGGGPGIFD